MAHGVCSFRLVSLWENTHTCTRTLAGHTACWLPWQQGRRLDSQQLADFYELQSNPKGYEMVFVWMDGSKTTKKV